jgi:hypothetical protein
MAGRRKRRERINVQRAEAGLPPLPAGAPTTGIKAPPPWTPHPASGVPASGRPAQPYPIQHGGRSPAVYGALARELIEALLARRPDLAAFPEEVSAWATAEAQARLFRRDLEERGVLDPDTGTPRDSSLRWLNACENRAASARARLGLDPRSEAALAVERAAAAEVGGTTQADALDRLIDRGRALLDTDPLGIEPTGPALEAAGAAITENEDDTEDEEERP